jgi:hypothetical protein
MKKGLKINTMLNYNAFTKKMVYIDKGKKLAIGNVEDVDSVFVDKRKFIAFKDIFIELIYHSKSDLFVEHNCKINELGKESGYGGTSKTASITTYSSFTKDEHFNELELPNGYEAKPSVSYWLKKNGKFKKLSNMKQVIKLYNKKDLMNEFIKTNHVEFDNQDSMVQLIQFLDQNN